jgi:hypothetical protein
MAFVILASLTGAAIIASTRPPGDADPLTVLEGQATVAGETE